VASSRPPGAKARVPPPFARLGPGFRPKKKVQPAFFRSESLTRPGGSCISIMRIPYPGRPGNIRTDPAGRDGFPGIRDDFLDDGETDRRLVGSCFSPRRGAGSLPREGNFRFPPGVDIVGEETYMRA